MKSPQRLFLVIVLLIITNALLIVALYHEHKKNSSPWAEIREVHASATSKGLDKVDEPSFDQFVRLKVSGSNGAEYTNIIGELGSIHISSWSGTSPLYRVKLHAAAVDANTAKATISAGLVSQSKSLTAAIEREIIITKRSKVTFIETLPGYNVPLHFSLSW